MNIFGRMNGIKRAIETDYDSWSGEEKPSQAFLPLRWDSVMLQILNMPVAVYVEPQPVSGEIDSAARQKVERQMSWGNNNGNTDAVYNGLDGAKDLGGARFPFFEEGRHKVAIVLLEEYDSKDGKAVRLIGEILESNTHKVGELHTKIWKIQQPPKFPGGTTPADEFADFCRKLKGAARDVQIGPSIRVLMKDRAAEQLARGMVIGLTAVPNAKKNWTNLYWEHVPQTPDQIAQHRQRIEATGLAATASAGRSQQPQPQYAQQPPQYAQQPQQGYQMPQQTWGAPTQQMQPPVQYAAPQQPQYTQQPTQAAPVQGGFLAQIPPTNNGQGGGNNGGAAW